MKTINLKLQKRNMKLKWKDLGEDAGVLVKSTDILKNMYILLEQEESDEYIHPRTLIRYRKENQMWGKCVECNDPGEGWVTSNKIWNKIVPKHLKDKVLCLNCFHRFLNDKIVVVVLVGENSPPLSDRAKGMIENICEPPLFYIEKGESK